jgi:RNase P subunit RPR2
MDSEKILEIVRKWKISNKPEFRGFRCARCQKEMEKAWHVWLSDGGYKLEVHFCRECGKELGLK